MRDTSNQDVFVAVQVTGIPVPVEPLLLEVVAPDAGAAGVEDELAFDPNKTV